MLTAARGVIQGNVIVIEDENLSDRDGEDVIVTFLDTSSRKQRDIQAIDKLRELFKDDTGWDSEKAMIADLADFRRSRMK